MLSTNEVVKVLRNPKLILGMFVTTLIIQASNNSISPILALFVRQIMPAGSPVTFYSGIVAAVPGVATLFAAPRLGRLGDKFGTELVLSVGFIFAIIVYIPMAFVTNVWMLIVLRFLIGISNATMLPAVQTLLSKNTPAEVTGRVFSYNQSFQAVGNVLGPLIGSFVSNTFDYRAVFISTSILVLLNFTMVWFNTKSMRKKHLDQI